MSKQIVEHNPENDMRLAKPTGRMTKAEQAIKQRLFAQLLLSPDYHYNRDEIMERVGISESTYYKWSKDPNLADMAGIEPNRHNLKAKLLAAQMKADALSTLHDVMENDRSGLARVRAAEIILGYDTNMEAVVDDDVEKRRVQQLLQINRPIFVMGTQDMVAEISKLQRLNTGEPELEGDEMEDDDFVESDYEYVDD